MTAIVLALPASALYGAADFLGGLTARRATALAAAAMSQLVGLIALLGVIPLVTASRPAPPDLTWGPRAAASSQ